MPGLQLSQFLSYSGKTKNEVNITPTQIWVNREAAKLSALSSGKIDKYEYLAGE